MRMSIRLAAPTIVVAMSLGGGACGSSSSTNSMFNSQKSSPSSSQNNSGSSGSGGSHSKHSAPAALCRVVRTLDTDIRNYTQSHGATPSQSKLMTDGKNLAEQATAAGPPYDNEVRTFARDQQGGRTKAAFRQLDKLEGQCGAPRTPVPNS